MPFNSIIDRTDAGGLIPEDVSLDLLRALPEASAVMTLGRKLPNLSRKQRRMPVASALATAYFVSGETGLKQATEMAWENKYIEAEELAVIVPIPENVLDDVDYDIWGEVRPSLEEAFGIAVDQAVLYGTNIPASWTTNLGAAGLLALATAASQVASLANYTDLYEALLGETAAGVLGVLGMLEEDGFMPDGHIAHMTMKTKLRNTRDANGQPIFQRAVDGTFELDGSPILFPASGAVVAASSLLFSGAWQQLVWALRSDITYKVLDQAVIQDTAGNIIYNLAQQDMVALRATMRIGFALPNPIKRINTNATTRCPFAVLTA